MRIELADGVTNVTKFVGDWYLARVYLAARERFHLDDWRASVDQRVAQLVLLVAELDDRARQRRALLDAETLGDRPRRHIAADHFQRNDLDFADQLFAHVDALEEMGRQADSVQLSHHELADAVVQHALAVQHGALFIVERRRIVLEILDEGARLGALIQDLRLAFVDLPALDHLLRLLAGKRLAPPRLV